MNHPTHPRIQPGRLFAVVCGILCGLSTTSTQHAADALPLNSKPTEAILRAPEEVVQGWRDLRLGMFVHWGPVSLRGTEIGWSRGREVPVEEYDRLYKEFNPDQFNASDWVALAKNAGFRYLILTAKHHDGFSLWHTQQSSYSIENTPFGRDVVRELAEACTTAGIAFGTYYSLCDWHDPDYPLGSPGGKSRKPSPNMDRFDAQLRAQLTELMGFGLFCLWFDGEWESPWTHHRGVSLNNWLHSRYPNLIINNRVGKGRQGMGGLSDPALHPGDFWTPEQEVGTFHRDFPWESCITIGRQWSWKPGDQLKSADDCLDILVDTVCGDGNLLLNVGPMPDGRIEPRQVETLLKFGDFVKRHAEAIYGTRGGPFKPGAWGGSTCRDQEIFLFLRQPGNGASVRFPELAARVIEATGFDGHPVSFQQTGSGLTIPSTPPRDGERFRVIRLRIDRPALGIEPIAVPPPAGADRPHSPKP